MVAAIGVTFSITMFISLLSFMAGLNDLLDGLIPVSYTHLVVVTMPLSVLPSTTGSA